MKTNNNTYTKLVRPSLDTPRDVSVNNLVPKYKIKRLAFVNHRTFWTIWNTPVAFINSIYILATSMCLSRFNDRECRQMLIGWHNKHDFVIDYVGINSIIKDTKEFTRKTVQERKRLENLKYRAKKKAMRAAVEVSYNAA